MLKSVIRFGLIFYLLSLLPGQTPSFAIQQEQKEWQEYASFQRAELLAFCNFLYKEQHYDRALLGYFQYLYRFPGDSLEPQITFRVARCYQQTGTDELADDYYRRVREIAPPGSDLQRVSWHYILNNQMEGGRYDTVLVLTENSTDPVDLTFRGYIHFHKMEWEAARQAFKSAEVGFRSREYSRKFIPIYQAIESVGYVPRKKTWITVLTALIPGGGFAYLGNWPSATASALSVLGVGGITALNWTEPKVAIPIAITGVGIYGISFWKTVTSVSSTNHSNLQKYVDYIILRYPASRFVGLDEPEFF